MAILIDIHNRLIKYNNEEIYIAFDDLYFISFYLYERITFKTK